ncbi:RNA polymerase sigma factor [Algoriphagus sp. A40]|uniref:RNA polymerase sigma factor n=1 Tax=Algoriphagus sp. A40 TaxID=1945863 RepID=UPI0009CFEC7E|nr:sigma-70 family RNA polymerase sigma factor [Algoriphagus sp. A40]OOG77679.1 RNA polymerase subunit sigma-24 [Algoriphagus sp. A40]
MEKKNAVSDDDPLLVQQVLNGDRNAFGLIIRKTERMVAQIVFKMVRNEEDCKDLAQDIYLKVFHNLPRFRFQAKLSTWIAQIAYNTCLNFLEKKKVTLIEIEFGGENSMEDKLESMGNKHSGFYSNEIESLIHGKELSKLLEEEINRLSPIYRTLITLYHTEEMSYSQIAEITQLPEGTVKNYLFRARKAMKENLNSKFKRNEL